MPQLLCFEDLSRQDCQFSRSRVCFACQNLHLWVGDTPCFLVMSLKRQMLQVSFNDCTRHSSRQSVKPEVGFQWKLR